MAKIQAKLAGRDFQPKRILATKDDVRSLDLGVLLVAATAVSRGTLDNGDTYTGFLGSFEYNDTLDPANPPKSSGKLFLPDGITAMILEPLEQMIQDQKDTGIRANVSCILKVGVQKAANPAGYEWTFEPVGEIGVNDPLASLRAALPAPSMPQIEDADKAKGKSKAA